MASSVTHQFVSAVPDGPDTDLVRPSNWNAEHTVEIEVEDLETTEVTTALVLHPDGAGGVAWGAETGAPADAEYVVGSASGSLSAEVVKNYLKDNYDPDAYPAVPNALDDEFEGGGAIDAKWTAVNNPASTDALNQTDFPGYLHVGLPENTGTDNLAARVQLYQAAPAGNQALSFVVKLSLVINVDAHNTEKGEFAQAMVYLMDSVNSEYIECGFRVDNALEAQLQYQVVSFMNNAGTTSSIFVDPSATMYFKLEKSTTAAYTSSNTYNGYFSTNGIIWYTLGSLTKTFTGNCDRVGLMWRLPKSQAGSPHGAAIADFFRRTV